MSWLVVDSSGLWLMPAFWPRTNSNGLRHHLVQFHGVVPGPLGMRNNGTPARPRRAPSAAARRVRWARRRRAWFPPRCAAGRAVRRSEFGQHIRHHRIALRVIRCAQVQRELAAAWHHVGGATGHRADADGADRVAIACCAPFDVQRQFATADSASRRQVHGCGAGVAGHARHLAQVAHAAVDGGHNAQRRLISEHRALLDVHFHKTQVVGRVAPQFRNVVHAQAGVLHGLPYGDAVGVFLVQPGGG